MSHWVYLWSDYTDLPDWGEFAAIALENLFPHKRASEIVTPDETTSTISSPKRFGLCFHWWAVGLIENGARAQINEVYWKDRF